MKLNLFFSGSAATFLVVILHFNGTLWIPLPSTIDSLTAVLEGTHTFGLALEKLPVQIPVPDPRSTVLLAFGALSILILLSGVFGTALAAGLTGISTVATASAVLITALFFLSRKLALELALFDYLMILFSSGAACFFRWRNLFLLMVLLSGSTFLFPAELSIYYGTVLVLGSMAGFALSRELPIPSNRAVILIVYLAALGLIGVRIYAWDGALPHSLTPADKEIALPVALAQTLFVISPVLIYFIQNLITPKPASDLMVSILPLLMFTPFLEHPNSIYLVCAAMMSGVILVYRAATRIHALSPKVYIGVRLALDIALSVFIALAFIQLSSAWRERAIDQLTGSIARFGQTLPPGTTLVSTPNLSSLASVVLEKARALPSKLFFSSSETASEAPEFRAGNSIILLSPLDPPDHDLLLSTDKPQTLLWVHLVQFNGERIELNHVTVAQLDWVERMELNDPALVAFRIRSR